MVPLLSGDSWGNDVRVQGFECLPDTDCNSRYNAVGAGYFTMIGVAMSAGRDFQPSDQYGGTKVAIVNKAIRREVQPRARRGREVHRARGGRRLAGDPDRGARPRRRLQQREEQGAARLLSPVDAAGNRGADVLLRADPSPERPAHRRDPGDAQGDRPYHPGAGAQDAAATAARERLPRPHDLDPVGGLCAPGDAAGGGGAVRSARLFGGPAHAGDRGAHGARGRTAAGCKGWCCGRSGEW